MNLKQWTMLIMFLIDNLAVGVYAEYITDRKNHRNWLERIIYFSCSKTDEYMDNSISWTIFPIMVLNTSA